MLRTVVQVIQVRMRDVHPGDIINKSLDDPKGWFRVQDTEELHTGDYSIIAASAGDSINGAPYDMVGLQIAKQVDAPDNA